MKAEIRILMADDHPVYREGLRQIISTDPAMKILQETGNGADALPKAGQTGQSGSALNGS